MTIKTNATQYHTSSSPPFGWCTPTSTVFSARTASPILTPPAHNGNDVRKSSGQGGNKCKNRSEKLARFAEKSEGKPAPLAADMCIK